MPLTTSTSTYNGQPYCFTGVEPGSWQCVTMNRTSVDKHGYASGYD